MTKIDPDKLTGAHHGLTTWLQLWEDGYGLLNSRVERGDYLAQEVLDMLVKNLREETQNFTLAQFYAKYANESGKELYRDTWDYYMNLPGFRGPTGVWFNNWVILSTFEDAAYFVRYPEILVENSNKT